MLLEFWLMTVLFCAAQISGSLVIQALYKKNMTVEGATGRQFNVKVSLECSFRCSMDSACDAYQYQNGDDNKDCSLIEPTADGGQTFTSDEQNYIYVKQQVEGPVTPAAVDNFSCADPWTAPAGWTAGDQPAFYRSFDTTGCYQLINGAQRVTGKIGYGVETDRLKNQTVEFADISAACIISPDNCTNGASLVMWLKLVDCPAGSIFMTSQEGLGTGFRLLCGNNHVKFRLFRRSDKFVFFVSPKLTDWFHVAWTIDEFGNDFNVTFDKVLKQKHGDVTEDSFGQPTGRMLIGRKEDAATEEDASVIVDEFSLWNRKLTAEEIEMMYDFAG